MAIAYGTNSYLSRTTSVVTGAEGFTFSLWVRIPTAAASVGSIFSSSLDNANYFNISVNTSSSDIIFLGAGGGNFYFSNFVDPGLATWVYLAGVYQTATSTVDLYHRLEGATSLTAITGVDTAPPQSSWGMYLFSNALGDLATTLQMQSCKVWKARLTADELFAESIRLYPRRLANLDTFFPFRGAESVNVAQGPAWTVNGSFNAAAIQPRVPTGLAGARRFRQAVTVPSSQARGRPPRRFVVPTPSQVCGRAIAAGTGGSLSRTASLPDPAITGMTCTFWVRFTGNAGNLDTIFEYSHPSEGFIALYVNTGSTTIVLDSNTPGTQNVTAPGVNTWVFVALTISGTTARALHRLEGATSLTAVANHTVVAPDTTDWSERLLIDAVGIFPGAVVQIAAFKQYKAVLTDAEIWEESQRLKPARKAGIDAFLPFLDASGKDASGAGLNWSVAGAPAVIAAQPRISLGDAQPARRFVAATPTPSSQACGRPPRRFVVQTKASTARGMPPRRFVVSPPTPSSQARGLPPRRFVVPTPPPIVPAVFVGRRTRRGWYRELRRSF